MSSRSYKLEEDLTADRIRYFFESKGSNTIVKVIEYAPTGRFKGKDVYNLGFGDYDKSNDAIIDDIVSNNKDVYFVFNTVLNSILLFFKGKPNGTIFVHGSDSLPEFLEKCRLNCIKNCTEECQNFGRRIAAYRSYVNKNYNDLIKDYSFFGGFYGPPVSMVEYTVGIEYDIILVSAKD